MELSVLNWILGNKEWLFSGIGVAALLALLKISRSRFRRGSTAASDSSAGSPAGAGDGETLSLLKALSPIDQSQAAATPRSKLEDAGGARSEMESSPEIQIYDHELGVGDYHVVDVGSILKLRLELVEIVRRSDEDAYGTERVYARFRHSGDSGLLISKEAKWHSHSELLMPTDSKIVNTFFGTQSFFLLEVVVKHINPRRELVELHAATVTAEFGRSPR